MEEQRGRDRRRPRHFEDADEAQTQPKQAATMKPLRSSQRCRKKEESFTCDQCGKAFTQSANLKLHKLTHTGVKSFTCDQCGKGFARSANLKLHKLTHTGVKSFTCDQCGKGFARSCWLKSHEVVHTRVKPFVCGHCGKAFTQMGNLKLHQYTHYGPKALSVERLLFGVKS